MPASPEWKSDIIPEIMDGKNIADYVDPDIMEHLMQLEAEEEGMAAADAAARAAEGEESDEDEESKALYEAIRAKKASIIKAHREEKGKNRSSVPRSKVHQSKEDFQSGLQALGIDAVSAAGAAAAAAAPQKSAERGRKRTRGDDDAARTGASASAAGREADAMEDDEEAAAGAGASKRVRSSSAVRARRTALLGMYGGDAKAAERARMSKSREPSVRPAQAEGLKSEEERAKAVAKFKKFRSIAFQGKQGESDRRIPDQKPKWLYSGKRGNGKTDRR